MRRTPAITVDLAVAAAYNPSMDDGLEYREEVYERLCTASDEVSRVLEVLLALNLSGTCLAAVKRRDAIRFVAVIDRYLAATQEVMSAAVNVSSSDTLQIGGIEHMRKVLEQVVQNSP